MTNLKESSFAKPKPTVGTSTRVLLKYSSTRLFWSNRRSFEYLSGTKRFGQADLFAFDFLPRNHAILMLHKRSPDLMAYR